MEKRIEFFGIIPIGLLMIALVMSILHLPNYALLIILGIIIFALIELPLFLIHQNRKKNTKKGYNIFTFFSLLLFIISMFFTLQHFIVPIKIALILLILTGVFLMYFIVIELKNKRIQISKVTFIHFFVVFIVLILINVPIQLQAPDYTYNFKIESPSYPLGKGSVIYFDEAHNNIHTLKDRLLITGKLLEEDGYIVKPFKKNISTKVLLNDCNILIISNALNDNNIHNWSNPTFSAFTDKEIENIKNWVNEGGSLLLIIDHMPLPGAAYKLAKEFGFELRNGHAKPKPWKENYFYRKDNTLTDNIITNGRDKNERIDSILAFDGSGFIIPDDAISMLTFDSTYFQWDPQHAWDLGSVEPYSISGFSQGAFKEYGKGKIVIYGEAMMFTAQLGAGLSWIKLGMNSAKCPNNYKLFLNTIHWLDGQMNK